MGLAVELGETAVEIRETVIRFTRDVIARRVAEIDQASAFPPMLWQQMEKLGLLGIATQIALDGNGFINEHPTGRLLRGARLYEIGAGTSEIRRMLIGRELFKETG